MNELIYECYIFKYFSYLFNLKQKYIKSKSLYNDFLHNLEPIFIIFPVVTWNSRNNLRGQLRIVPDRTPDNCCRILRIGGNLLLNPRQDFEFDTKSLGINSEKGGSSLTAAGGGAITNTASTSRPAPALRSPETCARPKIFWKGWGDRTPETQS